MPTQKNKVDLSLLDLRYQKKNAKWWIDTKTGRWIASNNIADYLPKETEVKQEPTNYWWNKI